MTLLRFAGVGAVGFVVDAAVMFILSFFIAAIPARGIAFWVAASSNWWLNRKFTFKAGSGNPVQQWRRFLGVSCIGFVPSWGCYWLLMQVVDGDLILSFFSNQFPELKLDHLVAMVWPLLAMVPGVLLGMLTNYLLAERWVFRSVTA